MAFNRKKEDTPFDVFRREKKKKSESIFSSGGEAIHALVQAEYAVSGRLGSAETVLVDRNNLLVSKVDMTLRDGTPVEIKTVGADEIRTTNTPRFEHVAQLSYYVRSQGLQKGYLMYVARENTGLRKVFSIDTNGIYKYVAEQSLEYMTLRRGGVDPGKYDFAFHEAVSSGRSNEYYIHNFSKISEEAKLTQARFKELQRKQAWRQTYRQLASGIYEKASLNRSGIQNSFGMQSEWGSPTKRKKNWKSPEQVFEQNFQRAKLDRIASEYGDSVAEKFLINSSGNSSLQRTVNELVAQQTSQLTELTNALESLSDSTTSTTVGDEILERKEIVSRIEKVKKSMTPASIAEELTRKTKEQFPNLGKKRYKSADLRLQQRIEEILDPTKELPDPNIAEAPKPETRTQQHKTFKEAKNARARKRGVNRPKSVAATIKEQIDKNKLRPGRRIRPDMPVGEVQSVASAPGSPLWKARAAAQERRLAARKKARSADREAIKAQKKAFGTELVRLRQDVRAELLQNLSKLDNLEPQAIRTEIKRLLQNRNVRPDLIEDLVSEISSTVQNQVDKKGLQKKASQQNAEFKKLNAVQRAAQRLKELPDSMFGQARSEIVDALLQKDETGKLLLQNKKPQLIPNYESELGQLVEKKGDQVFQSQKQAINELVKTVNPNLSPEEIHELQISEQVRTQNQLRNQLRASLKVDDVVAGQLKGDYRETLGVLNFSSDSIETIERKRAEALIGRKQAPRMIEGVSPEGKERLKKYLRVRRPSLEEIRQDPLKGIPEQEQQFLRSYLADETKKSGRSVEQIVTNYHEQRVLRGNLHRSVFPEILQQRKADPKFVPSQEWIDSLEPEGFKYGRLGETLDETGRQKSKQSFVRALLNRADEMVKDGTDVEFLERQNKARKFKRLSFPERNLDSGRQPINPVTRPPVEIPKASPLTFFDIETSFGRNSTTNSFILEFAGAHLDDSVTSEIATLQGLENTYRQNKAGLTKNSLHVQASILNEKALKTIHSAQSVEELIKSNILGKESFEFYQQRLKEQHALGRSVDVLQLIQEDARDLLQTTGSFKDGKFVPSAKYADFKQVETLEEFFESQKKLISEVDEFFGKVPETTLVGHNIAAFDVNKLNTHADNLRLDVKNIRGLHSLEQIDTLTSEMSKDFFTKLREASQDLPSDLRAAFFEKHEVASGDRAKTLRALETLSSSMGFVDKTAQAAGKGAHRAAYDVFQQNIPVYVFMQNFLEQSAEKQKEMAAQMLENVVAVDNQASLVAPRVLPDVISDIPTIHPETTPRSIPDPKKPNIVTSFLQDAADEADPYLRKAKHWTSKVEGMIDDLASLKKGQIHGTYFRRPALAIGGLAVAGLAVAGVALGSAFYTGPKSPIKPPKKVLVHEDARVFPEEESATKIEARAMTDFGSGYQGLKKVLQAPALKTPPIKNLQGKVEQLPGELLEREFQLTIPRKAPDTSLLNTEVISEGATVEVELLKNYERGYIINKAETFNRRQKWVNMNMDGTRPVFENHKNQIRHHRMSGV